MVTAPPAPTAPMRVSLGHTGGARLLRLGTASFILAVTLTWGMRLLPTAPTASGGGSEQTALAPEAQRPLTAAPAIANLNLKTPGLLADARIGGGGGPQNPADGAIDRTRPHFRAFERYEAIAELGGVGGPAAELALVSLLYDENRGIREAAVESLGLLGGPGAIQGISYALTDVDDQVRSMAIDMLIEIGTPDAINALATTLSDPLVDVRLNAVTELADLESLAAGTVLQAFLSDHDPLVRETAAEALRDGPY